MKRDVHVFDNGIKVYDDHITPNQRDRYNRRNVHEAEEENVFIEILKTIPPDGCFVNIGSAIGYYALLAKKLVHGLTIHAIEPLKRHRIFFTENIRLNGLEKSSFVFHTEGISSLNGKAKFLDKDYGSSIQRGFKNKENKGLKSMVSLLCKYLIYRTDQKKLNTTHTIKTRTLDSLSAEIEKPIDLCQMDVQGLEAEVLEGAQEVLQTGKVKTFLIGTHSQKLHDDCINLLVENGYVIEYDNYNTREQPDGILVASKGFQRLHNPKEKL